MKTRKAWLWFGVVPFGIVLLTLCGWHWSLRSSADRQLQALRARGERLELEQCLPAPTPPELNGAMPLLAALRQLPRSGILNSNPPRMMLPIAPGRALVGWREAVLNRDKATNTWQELEIELQQGATALAALEDNLKLPRFDFLLAYQQGFSLLLPHLVEFKRGGQFLAASMSADLHHHKPAEALQRLRSLVMLSQVLNDERLLISQLVRIAVGQIAFNATWEALQCDAFQEADLAALQQQWEHTQFLTPLLQALEMERAMGLRELLRLRETGEGYTQLVAGWGMMGGGATGTPPPPADPFEAIMEMISSAGTSIRDGTFNALWHYYWSYTDQRGAMTVYQVILENGRKTLGHRSCAQFTQDVDAGFKDANLSRLRSSEERDSWWFKEGNPQHMFTRMALHLETTFHRAMLAETSKEIARTALAIKRYQLRHQQPPKDLSALVPEFLSGLPQDPMDGQPLRYRPANNRSWTLYSVGTNGRDDGGDDTRTNDNRTASFPQGLDAVWPQPASADEVQAYYQTLNSRRSR